jgi:phosphopantetheinyl transferase (holo-ACP synthase)
VSAGRRPPPDPPVAGRAVEVVRTAELVPDLSDRDWVAAAFTDGELASLGDGGSGAVDLAARVVDSPGDGSPAARGADSLAARVAAKRAVLAAMAHAGRRGSGEREPEVLRSVELLRGPDGRPTARGPADVAEWEVAVSLSHDGGLAGALAVVGRGPAAAG